MLPSIALCISLPSPSLPLPPSSSPKYTSLFIYCSTSYTEWYTYGALINIYASMRRKLAWCLSTGFTSMLIQIGEKEIERKKEEGKMTERGTQGEMKGVRRSLMQIVLSHKFQQKSAQLVGCKYLPFNPLYTLTLKF